MPHADKTGNRAPAATSPAVQKRTGKPKPKPRRKKPRSAKKANGRPSLYSAKLATRICEEIAQGKTVSKVAAMEGMPTRTTIINWCHSREAFFDMYTRAIKTRAVMHWDESIDIADDGINDTYLDEAGRPKVAYDVIRRSELRVDVRKFAVMKLMPRLFGDRVAVETPGLDVVVRSVLGQSVSRSKDQKKDERGER